MIGASPPEARIDPDLRAGDSIAGSGEVRVLKGLMRTVVRITLLALAVAGVWSLRFRFDHIVVDSETYLVRVHRLTGHADILVPGEGWVPAQEAWDDSSPSPPASAS